MGEPLASLQVLAGAGFFVDFSESELAALAPLVNRRQLAAGDPLFHEGDACEGLFVVESGSIRIFKTSIAGREQILALQQPGSLVAELPVFDGGPYPASATATANTTLLFISKRDFRAFCLEHPQVSLKVLRTVGKRLRRLVDLIEELSFTTVRHRLGSLLLRIARAEGKEVEDGIAVNLPPQQELAAQIGTVRELISRNLGRFQAEGLLRQSAHQFVIPDPERLRQSIESD